MSPPRPADDAAVLTPAVLGGLRVDRDGAESGKDGRGTVLVIGGTTSTPGAPLLAGVAALRAGAGKLQLAVASGIAIQVGVAVPECACLALPQTAAGEVDPVAADVAAEWAAAADAVLIGPGLIGLETVPVLVDRVLALLTADQVVVVDAKAVEGLQPERIAHTRGRIVLTPNPVEAAALLEDEALVEKEPLMAARRLAELFGAAVALRGPTTWIVQPDGTAFRNETGNNGLGTSGSGDVCSGLVAGFAARGASPVAAAAWGVHTHARAGDRLLASVGRTGFLAREIAAEVPAVLTELEA